MNLKGFCRFWEGRRHRRAVVILAGLVVLGVTISGTERVVADGSSEFLGYRRIVQISLLRGQDEYEQIDHARAYPPFFALFWAPFGLLPPGPLYEEGLGPAGASSWEMVQIGLSAALAVGMMIALSVPAVRCIAASAYRPCEGERASCLPALLWLLTVGLMANAAVRCESDMFIVIMLAGAMYLLLRGGRPWSAGALLGVAAALKLTPGLFAVYLLCRRRWRALGGMAIAGAVCTFVLPSLAWGPRACIEKHRSWAQHVLIPYASGGEEFIIDRDRMYRSANQSAKAALMRYLTHYNAGRQSHPRYVNIVNLRPETVDAVASAAKLLILGVLVLAWTLPPTRDEGEIGPLLFGLVPLGMLLISDVSHGSMLSVLCLPVGALVGYAFAHAGGRAGDNASLGTLAGIILVHMIAVRGLKALSVGTAGVAVLLVVGLCVASHAWRSAAPRDPGPCDM